MRKRQPPATAQATQPELIPSELNELEKSQAARDNAWEILRGMQAAAARAQKAGDDARMALLARGVRDAQRAWEMASDYANTQAEAAGIMIPVDNVRKIQRELITPLGAAIRGLREHLASHLPPHMRPAFFSAFECVVPSFNARLESIDTRLERLLLC